MLSEDGLGLHYYCLLLVYCHMIATCVLLRARLIWSLWITLFRYSYTVVVTVGCSLLWKPADPDACACPSRLSIIDLQARSMALRAVLLVHLLFFGEKKVKSLNMYFSNSFDLWWGIWHENHWIYRRKILKTSVESGQNIQRSKKIADLQARSMALGAALWACASVFFYFLLIAKVWK